MEFIAAFGWMLSDSIVESTMAPQVNHGLNHTRPRVALSIVKQ